MEWTNFNVKMPEQFKGVLVKKDNERFYGMVENNVLFIHLDLVSLETMYWKPDIDLEDYLWSYFLNQPERLSEKTSKEDAIV